MRSWATTAASLALAACATDRGPSTSAAESAAAASTQLRTVSDEARGSAWARQSGDRIMVRVEAANLPAGTYAAHVHTVGRCDPPGFETAGGHWNPTGRQHGSSNPAGMHKGDLPNLTIGADGRGTLEHAIPDAWLVAGGAPLLDADGAAVVLHQRGDDYRSDPAGNAGARIACGVLR